MISNNSKSNPEKAMLIDSMVKLIEYLYLCN